MSNSSENGAAGLLFVIATVCSWLGSGFMAWNIAEPKSFGGVLVFLFAWAICGYIVDFVMAAILVFVISLFK